MCARNASPRAVASITRASPSRRTGPSKAVVAPGPGTSRAATRACPGRIGMSCLPLRSSAMCPSLSSIDNDSFPDCTRKFAPESGHVSAKSKAIFSMKRYSTRTEGHMKTILTGLLYVAAILPAAAQSTATLTGTVTDPSNAVIAGAAVTCINTATHLALHTVTNAGGLFRIADIPVGSYELSVSHPGFSTLVRGGIELLTDQTVDLSLVLRLGETNQSIAVTAPAPLVQGTTSDIQTT